MPNVLKPAQRKALSEIMARLSDADRDIQILDAIEYDIAEDKQRLEHLKRICENALRLDDTFGA